MTGSSAAERVPSEERIFSLVLALVASPQGLTKPELLSSVNGYSQRYEHGVVAVSLDRQFERDKAKLRALGIPVETIDSPLEPGNNQLTRYRISKERLQLPPNVRFTAAELMLLKLASLAWSDGSLGAESRWASMKLTSLGVNLDVRNLGIAPRLSILEPAAPALQLAINEGKTVLFDYWLPGRPSPLSRRVAPLRLHRAEGRWHLIGYDLERERGRVFLLSRIASGVSVTKEAFDPALKEHVEPTLARLLRLTRKQRAVVLVRKGSAAQARLEPRGEADPTRLASDRTIAGTSAIELGTLDFAAFADELAGYGDEVVALEPAGLREGVSGRLEAIRSQHEQQEGATHA